MTEDTKQDASKEQENNNMDWKKNGFDKRERLTLKINMEEAIRRQANNRIDKQNRSKLRAKPTKNKPYKKNKIHTSIYNDDEDEEDYILLPVFNNLPRFSLEKALTPKEIKQLEKMEKNQEKDVLSPEKIQIIEKNQPKPVEKNKNPEHANLPKKEKYGYIDLAKIEIKTEDSPLNKSAKNKEKMPKIQEKEDKNQKEIDSAINDINSKLSQENAPQKQDEKKDARDLILEKSGRANHIAENKKEEKSQKKEKTAFKQKEYEKTNER